MTFEAVDVSGKSSQRQKLDVVANQFKAGDYEQAALSAYELMTERRARGRKRTVRFIRLARG